MAEKEYIDKQDAIKEIYRFDGYLDDDMIWRLHYAIRKIPAAGVRPVVRARWKYIEYYPEGHDYKCQHCRFKNAEPTNYCPSCGAVMMGVDE